MKKIYRIKKNSEIDAVFKHRKSKSDGFFSIYYKEDENTEHFRFALSIGKKYGNAVSRNLAKRRIRMIIQSHKMHLKKNQMFVIVIRPNVSTLSYQQIKEKIIELFYKTKLMEITNE